MSSVSKVISEVLGRQSRSRRFGIDCPSELRWHAKEPGGDYKQKLVMRNVSTTTIKFKYKQPRTSFFLMNFPDLITLCPGMEAVVEVSFRPIRSEVYDDVIEFNSSNGTFFVRVIATLPEHGIRMQEFLDFGFSTVKEESIKSFMLRNVGEVDAPFELLVEPPFALQSDKGTREVRKTAKGIAGIISPGQDASVSLKFMPMDASVFVGTVICKQPNDRPTLAMKISGIGKLPFLQASTHTIDFGSVLTGGSKSLELILTNTTLVPVSFLLQPAPSGRDPVFAWSATAGRIPADASLALTARYTPLATDAFDCEEFDVITPGGNRLRVTCKGHAEPHRVSVSPTAVAFGSLELGRVALRSVALANATAAPAYYQFVAEPAGTFELPRAAGAVAAHSTVNLDLRFVARLPGNYYRRLFLLVRNQGPLYLDLTATAYHPNQAEVQRPLPLTPQHVAAHRERLRAAGAPIAAALAEGGAAGDPAAEAWNEFFLDDTDPRHGVHLDEPGVDFGPAPRAGGGGGGGAGGVLGEYRTVVVRNATAVRQTAAVVVPPDGRAPQPPGAGEVRATPLGPVLVPLETSFRVFPEAADVPPHGAATFRVAFRPLYDNAYFAQSLEIYVSPRSQRNFRLVADPSLLAPPLCLRPALTGDTLPPGAEPFTPKLRVPTTRIDFPPSCVGDRAYQVVEMHNDADTPMRFQLERDDSGVFRAKPDGGLIMPHCFQLVAFAFRPAAVQRYERALVCLMNGILAHSVRFSLVGAGSAPALMVEPAHVQIKPTCVGAVSTRTAELINACDVAIAFEVEVPETGSRVLSIEPRSGVMRGRERQVIHIHFAPKRRGPLSLRAPVVFWRVRGINNTAAAVGTGLGSGIVPIRPSSTLAAPEAMLQRTVLSVHGAGTGGLVRFEPEVVDFGTLLVGSEVRRVLFLINDSDCCMFYRMDSSMPENVSYQDGSGLLPAYSTRRVTLCFTPASRLYYNVYLTCRLRTGSEALETGDFGPDHTGADLVAFSAAEAADALGGDAPPTCHVLGNAVFPMLAVVDARSDGLSASRTWREFGLLQLNSELGADLTPREVAWNRAEIDETDPSKVLSVVEARFPPRERGSAPSFVVLRVRNAGLLPLDFALRFPRDDEDEPETWVDQDLQSDEERTLNFILEHKLFICQPRRGHLEVGEEVDVVLSYRHNFPTVEFRLAIVLAVCEMSPGGGVHNTGKQVVLALIGQTLQPGEPYLHLPVADPRYFRHNVRLNPQVSRDSSFNPSVSEWGLERTQVGLVTPPIQYYVLQNTGQVAVDYRLDLAEVEDLNSQAFNFAVVTCLDDLSGRLEPGDSVALRWIFNPLEAKRYTWTVPITVEGGDSRAVRFIADGVAPSPHDLSPPTPLPLPPCQRIPVPNQVVWLSEERFVLSDVPVGAIVQRMIFLSNRDTEQTMAYNFDPGSMGGTVSELLSFQPARGHIPPSGHAVVKLTLRSMAPSLMDLDVPCAVEVVVPEEEEEEDLGDEGEGSPMAGTRGAPSRTGGRGTPTGSSAGARGTRKPRRTSIVEMAPPYRGTKAPEMGKGPTVTFTERSVTADAISRRRSQVSAANLDDAASVRSGFSGMTSNSRAASVPASRASGATGITAGSSGSSAGIEDTVFDTTLFISIQASVRPCEEQRKLMGTTSNFFFPKSLATSASAIAAPSSYAPSSPTSRRSISSPVGGLVPSKVGLDSSFMLDPGQLKATEGILEQLLIELLADEDIMLAAEGVNPLPIPCFVQIVSRPPTPFRLEGGKRSLFKAPSTEINRQSNGVDSEAPEDLVCAGVDIPGHSAALPPDVEDIDQTLLEKERMRRLACALPEMENLAAFVLDSCIFNLLSEVSHGEESIFN